MSDRVEYIRRRLDELEAAAKAAPSGLNHGEWPFWVDVDDHGDYEATNAYRDQFRPAQMLARVAADRKLLAEHERVVEYYNRPENRDVPAGEVTGLYTAVRLMAEGLGWRDGGGE